VIGRDHRVESVSVFFITGRPQTQTAATVTNLTGAAHAGHQVKIPNPMYYLP
jgi:hypothetical protein